MQIAACGTGCLDLNSNSIMISDMVLIKLYHVSMRINVFAAVK